MICKILGQFVNMLITDDKYSLLNCGKLRQPIQMQLFKKQKRFSEFFFAVLKFRSNFDHLEKDNPHSSVIPEITDCEGRG